MAWGAVMHSMPLGNSDINDKNRLKYFKCQAVAREIPRKSGKSR